MQIKISSAQAEWLRRKVHRSGLPAKYLVQLAVSDFIERNPLGLGETYLLIDSTRHYAVVYISEYGFPALQEIGGFVESPESLYETLKQRYPELICGERIA